MDVTSVTRSGSTIVGNESEGSLYEIDITVSVQPKSSAHFLVVVITHALIVEGVRQVRPSRQALNRLPHPHPFARMWGRNNTQEAERGNSRQLCSRTDKEFNYD